MLSLSRKRGTSIEISGSGRIRLTIYRIKGEYVQLAFDGDDSMRILRSELLDQQPPAQDAGKEAA